MRAFARWSGIEGQILTDYSLPNPGKPIPHPLPEGIDGVYRLIAVTNNEKQQVLVALCGLFGCRVAEALRVRPSNFDLHEMCLKVLGKGDKERLIPISSRAWETIGTAVTRAYLEDDRVIVSFQDRFARRIITELGVRAGLQRAISSHDLRATFATAVYDKTLDLRVVQELLGHANSGTTEIYTQVSLNKMREAVEL